MRSSACRVRAKDPPPDMPHNQTTQACACHVRQGIGSALLPQSDRHRHRLARAYPTSTQGQRNTQSAHLAGIPSTAAPAAAPGQRRQLSWPAKQLRVYHRQTRRGRLPNHSEGAYQSTDKPKSRPYLERGYLPYRLRQIAGRGLKVISRTASRRRHLPVRGLAASSSSALKIRPLVSRAGPQWNTAYFSHPRRPLAKNTPPVAPPQQACLIPKVVKLPHAAALPYATESAAASDRNNGLVYAASKGRMRSPCPAANHGFHDGKSRLSSKPSRPRRESLAQASRVVRKQRIGQVIGGLVNPDRHTGKIPSSVIAVEPMLISRDCPQKISNDAGTATASSHAAVQCRPASRCPAASWEKGIGKQGGDS